MQSQFFFKSRGSIRQGGQQVPADVLQLRSGLFPLGCIHGIHQFENSEAAGSARLMPVKTIDVADIEKLRIVPGKRRIEFFGFRFALEGLRQFDLHAGIFPLFSPCSYRKL